MQKFGLGERVRLLVPLQGVDIGDIGVVQVIENISDSVCYVVEFGLENGGTHAIWVAECEVEHATV